jgi:hypothetical protein
MRDSRARTDRDAYSIAESVAAGATSEQTIELPADATIERVQVRIYVGAELDLELQPIIRDDTGTERPIVKFGGKNYIDGDDDFYQFSPSKPVKDNEEIVIRATNNDATVALDYRVNLDVDYAGGVERLFETIGGLF